MSVKRTLPAVAAAMGMLLGACYEYVPVQPSVPEAGAIVRVDVSNDASSRLTGTLGPGVLSVQGMVLRQEPDAIAMLVESYATMRNGALAGNNEPVLLQYPEISTLSLKTLSRKKSALLGLGFAGAAVLTATVFTDLGRHLTDSDTTTDPIQDLRRGGRFRIPIGVRIPLPGR